LPRGAQRDGEIGMFSFEQAAKHVMNGPNHEEPGPVTLTH
jgi:hypothetical protein